MTHSENRSDVVVIGGGLAGISAAIDLAEAGLMVTLLEARPWLGGATCSFARRGLTIDNGQHAFLRCCTAYRNLLIRLGSLDCCTIQDRLELAVLAPRGQLIVRRPALPAPLHLIGALASYRLLSLTQRAKAAAAAAALQFAAVSGRAADVSLGDWLASHGQDDTSRELLWDLLSAGAVGLAAEHADLAQFADVMRTAALAGRNGADIGVPDVPLSKVHAQPAAALLHELGVQVRLGTKAAGLRVAARGGYDVRLDRYAPTGGTSQSEPARDGGTGGEGSSDSAVLDACAALNGGAEIIHAAGVVLAVPAWAAASLAPAELAADARRWQRLEPSPLLSLHVVYGSPVAEVPFAAVAGSPVRWVIDKTRSAGLRTGQYLAASVPAAGRFLDWPAARLAAELLPELERLFPAAADADVEDFFVTRERRAVIRLAPGSRRLRAGQPASLRGLSMAGAWTDTGWPDTMEGAVRSGHRAALKVAAELRTGQTSGPAARVVPLKTARGSAVRSPAALSRAASAYEFPGSA